MLRKTSTLSNADQSQQPLCVHCHNTATFQCPSCGDAPILDDSDPAPAPWYCSAICQSLSLSRHNKVCSKAKMRKLLYRAGELLKDMFYIYRENLFPDPVLEIKEVEDGSLLFLYDNPNDDVLTNMGFLERFPSEIFSREEDKKAVLALRACCEAAHWMDQVVRYVLKGIASDILESTIGYVNPKRIVASLSLAGVVEEATNRLHEILYVSMKDSDEEYVIDLTGAQFGHQEAVFPFEQYLDAHLLGQEVHLVPLGTTREDTTSVTAPGGGRDTRWELWLSLNEECAPEYQKAVVECERLSGLKVKEVLGSSRENFLVSKKVLLNTLDVAMKARIKAMRKKFNETREEAGLEPVAWPA